MPQLWSQLHLKGHHLWLSYIQLSFSNVNVVYSSFIRLSFQDCFVKRGGIDGMSCGFVGAGVTAWGHSSTAPG